MVAYDISYIALSRLDTYQCYVIKEKITTVIAYLSGGMENANNDGADWRREITVWLRDNLGHSVVDPVIESNKLITENDAKDFRKWKESDPDRFRNFIRLAIKIDLDGVVNKADYVICLRGGGNFSIRFYETLLIIQQYKIQCLVSYKHLNLCKLL